MLTSNTILAIYLLANAAVVATLTIGSIVERYQG
jgi:hypothetical protein